LDPLQPPPVQSNPYRDGPLRPRLYLASRRLPRDDR
jgi:hypothetical protein